MISVRDKVEYDDEAVFSTLANKKLMSSITSAVGLITNRHKKREEDNTLAHHCPEIQRANTLTTRYKRILNATANLN